MKSVRRHESPITPDAVAARFTNARRAAVAEILETLVTLGHAHRGNTKKTITGVKPEHGSFSFIGVHRPSVA
jgi:hydroxyethylthiazole kinase-like sugar kinase family protein